MKTGTRFAVAAAMLLAATASSAAQEIEWSQMLNLPKGLNQPQGTTLDILGVEPGDSYAEARAKLDALAKEADGRRVKARWHETQKAYRLKLPGQGHIEAAFVGATLLQIDRFTEAGGGKEDESIELVFSAPSSGHQVIGIKRAIMYWNQEDQIRISELLAKLKSKFNTEPRRFDLGGAAVWYLFQYDDRKAYSTPGADMNHCQAEAFTEQTTDSVPSMNRGDDCDVMLRVEIRTGISPDHAKAVTFLLSDNERAKQNIGEDFAFFQTYIDQLRQRVSGQGPKL
jgi:hypothetical protein